MARHFDAQRAVVGTGEQDRLFFDKVGGGQQGGKPARWRARFRRRGNRTGGVDRLDDDPAAGRVEQGHAVQGFLAHQRVESLLNDRQVAGYQRVLQRRRQGDDEAARFLVITLVGRRDALLDHQYQSEQRHAADHDDRQHQDAADQAEAAHVRAIRRSGGRWRGHCRNRARRPARSRVRRSLRAPLPLLDRSSWPAAPSG